MPCYKKCGIQERIFIRECLKEHRRESNMITFKEIVIAVASATATIAVGYVALIGAIILTA